MRHEEIYRGYKIYDSEVTKGRYDWIGDDYDGAPDAGPQPYGYDLDSIQDCKDEIDDWITELNTRVIDDVENSERYKIEVEDDHVYIFRYDICEGQIVASHGIELSITKESFDKLVKAYKSI